MRRTLLLVAAVAVVPAVAAVDVSADSILRPEEYETPSWRFAPTALVRCLGTDSAVLTAWFTMVNGNESIVYRDSLTSVSLAPGRDTLLVFAQYLMGAGGGYWIARCSVAAPGDKRTANDTVTKRFQPAPHA